MKLGIFVDESVYPLVRFSGSVIEFGSVGMFAGGQLEVFRSKRGSSYY